MSRQLRLVTLVLAVLVLAACGSSDQPGSVSWRNISVDLPNDWYLVEEAEDRLSIANHPLDPAGDESGDAGPDGDVVAMYFTYEPGSTPDDWRRFVDEQGATLETDDQLTLDGEVPATRLVYQYETNGVPTREMVVVVPSREVVALALPIPAAGDHTAPEAFLEHIETFLDVLDDLRFGAPVLD